VNAKVTYKMQYVPHPFDVKQRAEGVRAWTLFEVTTPPAGPSTAVPIALFNFDSEAERFMGHVFADGLDGKLLEIDPKVRGLFEMQAERRSREGL
jgi:hypothetical protein